MKIGISMLVRRASFAVGLLVAVVNMIETATVACAGPMMADRTYSFTIKNDTGERAQGWYLGVPGIQKAQVDVAKSGGKTLTKVRVNPPERGGSGVTVFFENPAGIADGAVEMVTLRLTGLGAGELRFGDSNFRDKAGNAGRPLDSALRKFNPTHKLVGDPIFSLLNNAEVPQDYQVEDLQFLINAAEMPDPTVALDFDSSFGFVSASPSGFTMSSADEESMRFDLPPVDDGNWLYARFRLSDGGTDAAHFVLGQQYLVSGPPMLLLVTLGVVCGTVCRARRGRWFPLGGSRFRTGKGPAASSVLPTPRPLPPRCSPDPGSDRGGGG